MTLRLYLDEDAMRHSLANALRASGVDVATPLTEAQTEQADTDQLDYATAHGRVLYSHNIKDFTQLHAAYLAAGKNHAGIILVPQRRYGAGEQLRRLRIICAALTPEAMHNRLEFLSNWG